MKTFSVIMMVGMVIVALPMISVARMNETESQMQSRYGAPDRNYTITPLTQLLEGAVTRAYYFKGWTIIAAYLNGRVVRIHYSKQTNRDSTPIIQDDEAKAVLNAEAGNGEWARLGNQSKPVNSLPWAVSDKAWVHTNGNVACLFLNRLMLQIDSPMIDGYLAKLAAEKEAKRKASIPQF